MFLTLLTVEIYLKMCMQSTKTQVTNVSKYLMIKTGQNHTICYYK